MTRSADHDRPPSANYHANALTRGLVLLEQLSEHSEPQSLNSLCESTSLPKSTAVRLLAVLTEMEYAVRVDDRPSFRLGHKVQKLAVAYTSLLDLSQLTERHLSPLAIATGQTACVAVLDAGQVLPVGASEPPRPLRYNAEPGTRDFVHCTSLGKMLLSALDPPAVLDQLPPEPFPAFTEHTITSVAALEKELTKIRQRGWSMDDNERNPGIRCIAAPIVHQNEFLAAISVSGPAAEFGRNARTELIRQLEATGRQIAGDPDLVIALQFLHRSLRAGGPPARH